MLCMIMTIWTLAIFVTGLAFVEALTILFHAVWFLASTSSAWGYFLFLFLRFFLARNAFWLFCWRQILPVFASATSTLRLAGGPIQGTLALALETLHFFAFADNHFSGLDWLHIVMLYDLFGLSLFWFILFLTLLIFSWFFMIYRFLPHNWGPSFLRLWDSFRSRRIIMGREIHLGFFLLLKGRNWRDFLWHFSHLTIPTKKGFKILELEFWLTRLEARFSPFIFLFFLEGVVHRGIADETGIPSRFLRVGLMRRSVAGCLASRSDFLWHIDQI